MSEFANSLLLRNSASGNFNFAFFICMRSKFHTSLFTSADVVYFNIGNIVVCACIVGSAVSLFF